LVEISDEEKFSVIHAGISSLGLGPELVDTFLLQAMLLQREDSSLNVETRSLFSIIKRRLLCLESPIRA